MPVVGQRDAPCLLELGDVRELFAFLATRHGADRIDTREVGLGRLLQDVLGDAGVVVDGTGVRHARDGREAAGHRRRHAGRDRFLVLLPGLAEMDVHVDETGTDDESARDLDDGDVAIDGKIAPDARDPVAVDQQVERAVASVHRIDEASAFQ